MSLLFLRLCRIELELELIQTHMAQKPMLRVEVCARCVARESYFSAWWPQVLFVRVLQCLPSWAIELARFTSPVSLLALIASLSPNSLVYRLTGFTIWQNLRKNVYTSTKLKIKLYLPGQNRRTRMKLNA
jgi:hypothetical protein